MIGTLSASLFGVGVTPSTSSYESIATVSVGSGGAATVSFTSIDQSYKHLQIRAIIRKSDAGNYFTLLRFNSSGGSSYASHYLIGTGSAAVAGANAPSVSDSFTFVGAGSGNTSGVFSAGVLDILDYSSTTKNKTIRALSGIDNNGSGEIDLVSGLSMNTAAVTQIDLYPNGSGFAQYSHFALYGIKD